MPPAPMRAVRWYGPIRLPSMLGVLMNLDDRGRRFEKATRGIVRREQFLDTTSERSVRAARGDDVRPALLGRQL